MSSTPPAPTPAPVAGATQYVWQTCLNVEDAPATPYQQHFNPQLLDVLAHPPRVLLDVGCSSGNLGKYVKSIHPACRTIGIEPNRATAEIASKNLDQVLCGKFEAFTLEDEGIVHGSLVTCPLHNWVFDLATGRAQGADTGQIATHAARVEGGRILLDATLLARRSAA